MCQGEKQMVMRFMQRCMFTSPYISMYQRVCRIHGERGSLFWLAQSAQANRVGASASHIIQDMSTSSPMASPKKPLPAQKQRLSYLGQYGRPTPATEDV